MSKFESQKTLDTGSDLLAKPYWALRILNMTLVLLVGSFLFWASQSTVEQATRAEGYVIPAGKVQLVQNLEGGIIEEIYIADGDRVNAGQPLVHISSAKITANLNEAREKIIGFEATLVRLRAERDQEEPRFTEEFQSKHMEIAGGQIALFRSNKKADEAFVAEQNSEIAQRRFEIDEWKSKQKSALVRRELAEKEYKIINKLVQRGAAPSMELLTLKRQLNEINETIETAKVSIPRLEAAIQKHEDTKARELQRRRSDILDQINLAQVELSALLEAIKGSEDQLNRTIVRAPVSGTIKAINVNTLGQVVSPGMDIAEIIPANKSLLIEGKVQPQDIAFLRPDLDANIRMTAYDFSVYGSLKGKLETISADSIEDEQGNRFFHVTVRANRDSLVRDGEELPIISGMTAEINIVTGKKTVLEYLMKPVIKTVSSSLHER